MDLCLSSSLHWYRCRDVRRECPRCFPLLSRSSTSLKPSSALAISSLYVHTKFHFDKSKKSSPTVLVPDISIVANVVNLWNLKLCKRNLRHKERTSSNYNEVITQRIIHNAQGTIDVKKKAMMLTRCWRDGDDGTVVMITRCWWWHLVGNDTIVMMTSCWCWLPQRWFLF